MKRFWEKVNKGSEDTCWEWQASTRRDGYGQFRFRGTMWAAHRVAYLLEVEEPDNHVLHTCDNKRCVNPAHLYEGSHSDNMQDFHDRQRGEVNHQGERNPNAKLTDADVREIRRRSQSGETYSSIADDYDVTSHHIGKLVRGEQRTT